MIIGSVQTLQPFAIDPYLPSSKVIAGEFGVDISLIQLTISTLALGFAIGQLIVGPLSDALGRRRPLLIAMTVYMVATALVGFAPSLPIFFAMRVLQGLSASSVLVVGNAMIRDLFDGSLLVKAISRAMLFQAASWFIGPFGAAYLLTFMDWRGIALVLAGVSGALLLLAVRFLPDTLHRDNRKGDIFSGMLGRFRAVLRDREYTGLVGISVMFQMAIYCYLLVVPIIYGREFGVAAATVGFLIGLNSVGSYTGLQVAAKISQYIHPKWVLTGVIGLGLTMGISMVLFSHTHPPFWLGVLLVWLFVVSFGASITPNTALAMAPHGHEAGTAAALMGVLSYLLSSAAGPFYTTLDKSSLYGVGLCITSFMVVALLLMFTVVRPRALRPDA
jgi:DHA1 family bicyclomycin/chloramphenicol resistance-like MFS transporter